MRSGLQQWAMRGTLACMIEPEMPAAPAAAPANTPSLRPRKFLVVVDETPECDKALRFAAKRASLIPDGRVVLMSIIPPVEFVQWGGVQEVMEEEARSAALEVLQRRADAVEEMAHHRPELVLKFGKTIDQVLKAIQADTQTYALVLGASARGEPGPLVDYFTGPAAGELPCLLVIVPGGMSDEGIDRLIGSPLLPQ